MKKTTHETVKNIYKLTFLPSGDTSKVVKQTRKRSASADQFGQWHSRHSNKIELYSSVPRRWSSPFSGAKFLFVFGVVCEVVGFVFFDSRPAVGTFVCKPYGLVSLVQQLFGAL